MVSAIHQHESAMGVHASHHVLVLSCSRASAGSVVVARGLSCPLAHGILVPQPAIEPGSPALEAGFLTTGPPGKSLKFTF